MKRILALILTVALCLPLIPASAIAEAAITTRERRAALQAEVDQHGGVEEAMSAYAKSRLRPQKKMFASMAELEHFGFRKTVKSVYDTGTPFTDFVMKHLIEAGIAISANDNNWNLSENDVRLFMENMLLIAEMEALSFEKITENVKEYVPDYNVGWGVAELVLGVATAGVNAVPYFDGNVLSDMGSVFAKDLSKDSFARHVLTHMDEYYNVFNNTAECTKLLDEYLSHEPAVKNMLSSWKRMYMGQALLAEIQKGGVADENLKLACLSMGDGYMAFCNELLKLAEREDAKLLLENEEYLDGRLDAHLEASFVRHPADSILSAVAGIARAADVFLTNGVGMAAFEAVQTAGDLTVGTKSSFVHFHAMRSLDTLYAELLQGFEEPKDGASWRDYYNYALNVQRLCKIALLGERHLYELTSMNAGLKSQNSEHKEDNAAWYKGRVDTLGLIYNFAEEYMTALTTHYGALAGYVPSVKDMLGHENELQVTIAGKVIHDKWFADVEDPTKPDLEKPNPKAGEPVSGLPVYLKVGETIIGSGETDSEGAYSITVYRYEIEGRGTTIQLGDTITSDVAFADILESEKGVDQQFAKKDIAGVSCPTVPFRASYPYNLDAGETALDTDMTVGYAPVPYADDYFLADPTAYNHNLAIASAALSAAAVGDAASGSAQNARTAWSSMGFSVVHRGGYGLADSEVNHTTGYTIAQKVFEDEDARDDEPKMYRVVGVAIEGDVSTAQMAQLFNAEIGEDGYQLGVGEAAQEVFGALADYLVSVDDELPVCVWITGFSRGGAVANAVAQKLTTTSALAYKWDKLFAYTFGAPKVGRARGYESRGSVFNIVHEKDLIATLYDEWITYGRMGEVLSFDETSAGYGRLIASAFDLMTGGNTHYNPWLYEANRDVLDMMNEAFPRLSFDPVFYADNLQPLVMAIAHWTRLGGDPNAQISLMDKHNLVVQLTSKASDSLLADIKTIIDSAEEGMTELVVDALPKEIYDNLEMMLTDVLLLTAYHNADLSSLTLEETVNANLVTIVSALMGDMSSTTGVYGTAFAHHPEVYLAWLMGMSGESLFGKAMPEVFNSPVMPLQYNLCGTVMDEEDHTLLEGVQVIAWNSEGKAVKQAFSDEEGWWEMLVEQDNYRITFDVNGYEPAETEVGLSQMAEGVVELETYMKRLEPTTVYITTESTCLEGEHYYVNVHKPLVTIPDYPSAAAKINNTISTYFSDIEEEIRSTKVGAAECRYDMQDHSYYAYLNTAYSNGGFLALSITRGRFVCHVGHNMNTGATYVFDLTTGNLLELEDLFDPENPEAEAAFLKLIEERLQEEGHTDVTAGKVYSKLKNETRYSSWRLDQDGMILSFDRLNLGFEYPNSLRLPMERLAPVLAKQFRTVEVAANGTFSIIDDGSREKAEELSRMMAERALAEKTPDETGEEASERPNAATVKVVGNSGGEEWEAPQVLFIENTPSDGGAIVVDGMMHNIWVTLNYGQGEKANCSSRYFYAFGLENAMIMLPGVDVLYDYDPTAWITWQDNEGYHYTAYAKDPSAEQEQTPEDAEEEIPTIVIHVQ